MNKSLKNKYLTIVYVITMARYNKKIYKSYNYKKKRGVRRKSYWKKLKDKKINTLYEKRSKQIVDSALQKATPYYLVRGVYLDPGSTWPLNDTFPTVADGYNLLESQFFVRQFAHVGGYLETDISNEMIVLPTENRDMKIHIKQIKLDFAFVNQGIEDLQVDLCIWRFPYNKYILANTAIPGPLDNPTPQYYNHKPFTPFYGIDKMADQAWKEDDANMKVKKHLIGHKRITVPHPKMIDDPAAGGSNRQNTVKWKSIKIVKTYKGLGYSEDYQIEPTNISPIATAGSLSKNRYFITIRTTDEVRFRGIATVKFCRGKGTPDQVVFDRIAPNSG